MRTPHFVWFTAMMLAPLMVFAESPQPRHKDEDSPTPIAAAARQAWAITDLVFEQDIDPPARQQMLLHAIKALLRQSKGKTPANLAERVSSVTTPEQFAALLAEVWPADKGSAAGESARREPALLDGLLRWRMSNEQDRFYLSPQDVKRHEMLAGNRYVGTGIQIRKNDEEKLIQIMVPFPGGPARKAGARPGDLIVEVDGKSMEGVPLPKVVECLQGEEGTKVSMTVRQPGESKTRLLPMVRSVIPFSTVHGYRRTGEESWAFCCDSQAKVGYLSIEEIKSSTLLELRKIEPLVCAEGVQSLVLDLRFTRGDDLRHAALVADGLIDGGTLWYVHERHDRTKQCKADRNCLFRDMPIMVLVSEHTPSIAALVAAALQDRDRAVLVGEMPRTGLTVTSLVRLPEERGAVRLRTGRVERVVPVAASNQQRLAAAENRLLPDHTVSLQGNEMIAIGEWKQQQESPEPKADAKPPSDPQLNKAIALLHEARKKSGKKGDK